MNPLQEDRNCKICVNGMDLTDYARIAVLEERKLTVTFLQDFQSNRVEDSFDRCSPPAVTLTFKGIDYAIQPEKVTFTYWPFGEQCGTLTEAKAVFEGSVKEFMVPAHSG